MELPWWEWLAILLCVPGMFPVGFVLGWRWWFKEGALSLSLGAEQGCRQRPRWGRRGRGWGRKAGVRRYVSLDWGGPAGPVPDEVRRYDWEVQ